MRYDQNPKSKRVMKPLLCAIDLDSQDKNYLNKNLQLHCYWWSFLEVYVRKSMAYCLQDMIYFLVSVLLNKGQRGSALLFWCLAMQDYLRNKGLCVFIEQPLTTSHPPHLWGDVCASIFLLFYTV